MLPPLRFKACLTPARVRGLKVVALVAAALLAVLLLAVFVHRGLLPILAWIFPSLRPALWDLAVYGAYPTTRYVSFALESPEASIVRWDDSCDDGLVLVSPFGKSVPHDGPMILEAQGGLVWTTRDFGTVMNFRMQMWKGREHLTFWAGQKSGSVGSGAYFILDSSYNVVKKVHAVGAGLKGDLHEFEITDDGTALITIYAKRQVDMRPMGLWRPEDGWIMDSIFQEVDIETGELRFEWKASDHFRPDETFYTSPLAGRWKSLPFDFFHINSMQKDSLGNFLISSRHLHAVTYVNGSTGETEWVLGGNHTDFKDLSGGHASDFRWQHHARWFSEEERILSVFDNQAAGPLHEDAAYSKGMLIQVDLENMSARLLQSYVSLGQTRAASQGSVQLIDRNDHVFVGWGSSGAYTEFNIAGEVLCETHLAAESTYWWERVKSYRAYKVFDWVGRPEYPPTAVMQGQKVYVHWNGATEVKYWELQGSSSEAAVVVEGSHKEGETETPEWHAISLTEKTEFEGSFTIPSDRKYRRYRVAALDGEKMYMRYSEPAEPKSGRPSALSVLLGVLVAAVCIAAMWMALKVWTRRRQGRHAQPLIAGTWEMSALESIKTVFGRKRHEYSQLVAD